MQNVKDDKFEFLLKQFLKETMSRNFGDRYKENRKRGFEELFDMFKEFTDSMTNTDSKTVDVEEVKDRKSENMDASKEIAYLKGQIEQLKEQLHDKDDIIKLLKEQNKKLKKKSS